MLNESQLQSPSLSEAIVTGNAVSPLEGLAVPNATNTTGDHNRTRTRLWAVACTFAFSLCLIVGLVFIWSGNSSQKVLSQSPLIVAAEHLDLGQVWETGEFKTAIPIKNISSAPVSVVGFSTSCGCLSIEPQAFHLDPGHSQIVQIKINLMLGHRSDQHDFGVHLSPQLEGNNSQQDGWLIRGSVRRLLRLSDTAPYIRVAPGDPSAEAEKVIEISSAEGLDRLEARVEPPLASVLVERDLTRKDRFVLKIRPAETLPPKPFQFSIHLTARRGNEAVAVTIPVRGSVQGRVYALPDYFHLGLHQIGLTVAETVVLRSVNNQEFAIETIVFDPRDVNVEASMTGGTAEKRFLLTQRISEAGKQDREIVFKVRFQDGTAMSVHVGLTYLGSPSK